jgi:hypothetical protein
MSPETEPLYRRPINAFGDLSAAMTLGARTRTDYETAKLMSCQQRIWQRVPPTVRNREPPS